MLFILFPYHILIFVTTFVFVFILLLGLRPIYSIFGGPNFVLQMKPIFSPIKTGQLTGPASKFQAESVCTASPASLFAFKPCCPRVYRLLHVSFYLTSCSPRDESPATPHTSLLDVNLLHFLFFSLARLS